MKKIVLLVFTLFTIIGFAQNVKRVTINGKIIVSSNDKEGVTVFNSSSNKGSLTDSSGNFEIDVALNDVIEFSALQFKDFKVSITPQVIKEQQLTVILVEEINKLDEVVILPFGLTGNIDADLENVRTYNVNLDAIYFGLDNITDFEFSADYKTRADNLAFNEANPLVNNMLDLVNVTGFLLGIVIKDFGTSKSKNKKDEVLERTPFRNALDTYSFNYIQTNFNIPNDSVEKFIDYVDDQNIPKALFESNKELQLLEKLMQLSDEFLKIQRD